MIGALLAAVLTARQAAVASALQCTAQWEQLEKDHQAGALNRQAFMAGCLSGRAPVGTPIVDAVQTAPSGGAYRCRDGMYAASPFGCASHRGVAARLR